MHISIISSTDKSTKRINEKVFPLALESLKESNYKDIARRYSIFSKLQSNGYYSSDENVVMSISFDPKSCGMPLDYCNGDCSDCMFNPLVGLLDPHVTENKRGYVITRNETIDTLLDVIILLAKASKRNLSQE